MFCESKLKGADFVCAGSLSLSLALGKGFRDDRLFKGSAMTKRGAYEALSYMACAAKTERNRTRSKKLSRHSSRRQQSVRLWGRVPAPCPRGQPSPRFRPPHSNMVHLRWSSPNKRRFLFFPDQLWRRKMSSLTPCSLPTTSASLRMSNPRSK